VEREPARAELERSLRRHPASHVVDVAGVGHWIHQERPQLVGDEIDRWLPELDPHPSGGLDDDRR
jgi:pimeloyl-ACP methyl ester carboxylesterase